MSLRTELAAALPAHWPCYLAEAGGLALFMACASLLTVALEHPASPVHQLLVAHGAGPAWRRVPMGLGMGLVIAALAYIPWCRRSGGHINPAITLAFWQLGRIGRADALWYGLAQAGSGIAAAAVLKVLLGTWYAHPAIHFITTRPGTGGVGVAPSPPGSEPITKANRAAGLAAYGQPAEAEKTLAFITAAPLSARVRELVVQDNLRTSRAAWNAWLERGSREDISALVSQVQVPCRLLVGAADRAITLATQRQHTLPHLPAGTSFEEVAGAGHLLPLEVPGVVAAALTDFGQHCAGLPLEGCDLAAK